MEFKELFVPMFFAFVAASLVMEALHALLAYWVNRRHAAKVKEHYKEMAEQMGMDPDEFMAQVEEQMAGMGGMGMMEGGPSAMMGAPMGNVMTTTSGGGHGHGQYL